MQADQTLANCAEITRLEDLRCQALLNVDIEALEDLCSDQLVYTHTRAGRDGKASFIERVRTGYYRYIEFTWGARDVQINGTTAVLFGALRTSSIVNGEPRELNNAMLSVWVKEPNGWKFFAYQPTPIPSDLERAVL